MAISWVLRRDHPFSTLLWVIPACLFVWGLLSIVVDIPRRRREKEIEKSYEDIKLGMTEKELIQKLGEPINREWVATNEMDEQLRGIHSNLWRYEYCPRLSFSSGWILQVFIDDQSGELVHIRRLKLIRD